MMKSKSDLTNDQYIALQKIKNFIESETINTFILNGYAGTGKTFLIKEIVNYLKEKKRNYFLAAPTGRAARMLNDRISLPASTIHKLIYHQTDTAINEIKEIVWHFGVKDNQESYKSVYIFDESSMISDTEDNGNEYLKFGSGRLLYDILEFAGLAAKNNKSTLDSKVIFIGDPAQLPPISNNDSFALSKEYLAEEYGLNVDEFKLSEIVRHREESPILKTATKIRKSIDQKIYNVFEIDNDVQVIDKASDFNNNWTDTKFNNVVISYSNEQALQANMYIRNSVLAAVDLKLLPNEKLIVVANNYNFGLMNGEFIELVEIIGEPHNESIYLKGRDKNIELTFRKVKIKYPTLENNYTIKEVLIIDNLLWSNQRSLSGDELIALRILAEKKSNAKLPSSQLKKSNPDRYKNEKEEYVKKIKESPYYNALQVKFGYAVTCHKAQGGEWDSVFVKFDGVSSYHNETFYRWAYTAITRAKKNLFALNPPHFNAWSNLINNEMIGNEDITARESGDSDFENIKIPFTISGAIPKNIYRQVYQRIKNTEVEIVSVKSLSWKERYKFKLLDKIVVVDFCYKQNGKITPLFIDLNSVDSKESINKLIAPIKIVATTESEEIDLNFPVEFLSEFFDLLKIEFHKYNIKITKLIHKEWAEEYTFKNDKDFCELNFYYNAKNVFSRSGPQIAHCSNNEFQKKCLTIISKAVKL